MKVQHHVHKHESPDPILTHHNPVPTSIMYFSMIQVSQLVFSFPYQVKCVIISSFLMCATCYTHPILLDLPMLTILGE